MFRLVIFILTFFSILNIAYAQLDSVAVRLQNISIITEDSIKLQYADEIPACLEQIKFGEYPLGTTVRFLGYRKCVNADVELFSYAIPLKEGQMFYNWFRFKEDNRSYLLKTSSVNKSDQPAWLFYDLVEFKNQGKFYFALLGWNKTRTTNQKIVQIVRFGEHGKISFNHRLMRRGKSRSASLSFEYALDGSMMLKQDKKGKRIIFDHLAPSDRKYEGYFMFYGPDASYDALILKGGEWWYEENVKV